MTALYSNSLPHQTTRAPATGAHSYAQGQAFRESNKALWTGRVLSGLISALLLMDATMKLLQLPEAVKGTAELGYPSSVVSALGVVQLVCLALYLVPRTASFGALLWTGYLGGAIATHVRVEHPLFSHVLFPIYVAAILWLGLWLRDARVRGLFARRA